MNAYKPDHPIQLTSLQTDHILKSDPSLTLYSENLRWAAQVGADMQLEKCFEWMSDHCFSSLTIDAMKNVMRPRPPSKRERALKDINALLASHSQLLPLTKGVLVAAREALMEGQGDG